MHSNKMALKKFTGRHGITTHLEVYSSPSFSNLYNISTILTGNYIVSHIYQKSQFSEFKQDNTLLVFLCAFVCSYTSLLLLYFCELNYP